MRNTVVAHLVGETLLKGYTNDFFPGKPTFHLEDVESNEVIEIEIAQLKALFFVKSFEGDKTYNARTDLERPGLGRRIRVRFKDSEVLEGYTSGYSPGRAAFFVFPLDPDDNNNKIFVLNAATEEVTLL